ncbi:hypothetical protein ASA1KI_26340 [Opitutales bacterium ASA1]|uniref:hypothetical protein n=1 Tax=Congregicoccus parvus TaxID=3081749 RepID=UPI002B3074BB|nr:hypothetical protein ASA1KI_26340 [Opitutales bacterium ASA1]
MGYIFAIAILAVGVFVVLAVVSGRGKGGGAGRLRHRKPVEFREPASDEPTPGASDTATSRQIGNAQRKVPPA